MTSNGKWTGETIRALGTTTSIQTLADIIGCGKGKAYRMARQGQWERIGIRVIWISPRYRVVVQSILDVLGLGTDDPPHPRDHAARRDRHAGREHLSARGPR